MRFRRRFRHIEPIELQFGKSPAALDRGCGENVKFNKLIN